jgi:hypothetical protein
VWREARRVKEDREAAPDYVKRLLLAARRIDGDGPTVDGKPLVLKPADFAEYIRAQGGVLMGRDYLVRVAHKVDEAPGRYGIIERETPVGVYGVTAPEVLCESNRYEWTRAGRVAPRSPLNNCTQHEAAVAVESADLGPTREIWFSSHEFTVDQVADAAQIWWDEEELARWIDEPATVAEKWLQSEGAADESRANTVWTEPSYSREALDQVVQRAKRRGMNGRRNAGAAR